MDREPDQNARDFEIEFRFVTALVAGPFIFSIITTVWRMLQ